MEEKPTTEEVNNAEQKPPSQEINTSNEKKQDVPVLLEKTEKHEPTTEKEENLVLIIEEQLKVEKEIQVPVILLDKTETTKKEETKMTLRTEEQLKTNTETQLKTEEIETQSTPIQELDKIIAGQEAIIESEKEIQPEVEKEDTKETRKKGSEKKRQAPKAPTVEEFEKAAAKLEPQTVENVHIEKSPMTVRNIKRIEDKPRRQPKTGWL